MTAPDDKPYVGGQAVIEGVMMRAPRSLAVAVRRPDGSIVVREDAWVPLWERFGLQRIPLIRGTVVLVESLYNGIQALNFAAAHADPGGAGRGTPGSPDRPGGASAAPAGRDEPRSTAEWTTPPADDASSPSHNRETALTIAVSFMLAMGLFVGLPHLLAWGTGHVGGYDLGLDTFGFHALDGVFKLLIFVAYIAGISMVPEIRRVFEYHGAEHKVVNLYENGLPLDLETARKQTTFHARCGTSFILFVLVLSIFLFAAVFPAIPSVSDFALVDHLAMIGIKIPLMMPVAGLAYEVNRFAARHPDRAWVQLLVAPGRLMQKLTTREPADDQLEIALCAMRAALAREHQLVALDAEAARRVAASEPHGGRIAVFPDYSAATASLGH